MLKYLNTAITFAEIPNEISLCINITNCPNHCKGCFEPELWEDIGKKLTWDNLNALIHINEGITCVCFMGGDNSPKEIDNLAYHVHKSGLLVGWYSGKEELSKEINLENFNFIKLGSYNKESGPLNTKTTNQRFYEVIQENQMFTLKDETYLFWK